MSEKWDRRYLDLAKFVSTWSKDPSTRVGAVIVSPDNFVLALGYNGLPRGVADLDERLNDRELKYPMIVHAERNAIISARQNLTGATLYTYPFMTCAPCAGMVIQAGIARCVSYVNHNPKWQTDFEISAVMFNEAGVLLNLYKE